MAVKPISQTIMETIISRLEALKEKSDLYHHTANSVEERALDLPDQGSEVIWVFVGDEQKSPDNAFGKLSCVLPVVIRWRHVERDKSKQARVLREMAADVTRAVGDEFSVADDIGQPVMARIDETMIVRNIEAPENTLLDILVAYDVSYMHEKGDQGRG